MCVYYLHMDRDLYTFGRSVDARGDVCFRLCVRTDSVALYGRLGSDDERKLAQDPSRRFLGRNAGSRSFLLHTQLFSTNKPLSAPVITPVSDRSGPWTRMPFAIRDLPLDAQLTFTILEPAGPGGHASVGGCTLPLFGSKACAFTDQITTTRQTTSHAYARRVG